MMSVVPQPDYRPRNVVFISDRAQARRAQKEGHTMHRWFESDPAGGQHPNEVPTREEQYIPSNHSDAAQHIFGSCSYLGRRFASRAAVAKQMPVRALCTNLCRGATLIRAVVPLHQVVVD